MIVSVCVWGGVYIHAGSSCSLVDVNLVIWLQLVFTLLLVHITVNTPFSLCKLDLQSCLHPALHPPIQSTQGGW